MHGGTYYSAPRDIADAREITAFEHILKKFGQLDWKVANKQQTGLDDAREITAFLNIF